MRLDSSLTGWRLTSSSPDFSHLFVTKRRKGCPDKACEGYPPVRVGPRKHTVWYAEEADGGGTRFAGRAVRADYFADAVE